MKKVNPSWLLPILLVLGGAIIFFGTLTKAESATAGHVVISEVQTAGVTVGDEFVELYNPTSSSVDLSGWRLRRETSTGGDGGNLVASLSGNIPAHGFFLITPQTEYTGSASADKTYSVGGNPVAANNTVLLYSDAAITLVDKVGVGSGASTAEGTGTATPSAGGSIERRANSSSDATSMGIGGSDEFAGNGEDTENNSNDFVLRTNSQPQNSSSAVEPVPVPTPSNTPIPSPTDIPTVTPTVAPTDTPTPTIEPTASPSPTEEPTPTSTPELTATPTVTIAPFPTLSPAPTATVTPNPTGTPAFPRFTVVCSTKFLNFNFGFIHIQIPLFTCRLVRI